jgi:hypothetical protein
LREICGEDDFEKINHTMTNNKGDMNNLADPEDEGNEDENG